MLLVVALRQCERQTERDKELMTEELRAVREQHEIEVQRLSERLQSVQAENNLLMVSR